MGPKGPFAGLAADASGVYWSDASSVNVVASPGQTPVVLASQRLFAVDLRVDAQHVYWMGWDDSGGDGGALEGGVWRVAKGGGTPELLGPLTQKQFGSPYALSYGIVAYADLATITAAGPVLGASYVLASQSPSIATITADDATFFWTAGSVLTLSFCLGSGGCPAAAGPPVPDGIFSVRWLGGAVQQVSPRGGFAEMQVAGSRLYGLTHGDPVQPVLERVEIASGEHTLVAAGDWINAFAIDATRVYWTRGSKLLATPR
jgi:hypothetical protein